RTADDRRPALSATGVRRHGSARRVHGGAAGRAWRPGFVDVRGEFLRAERISAGCGRRDRPERLAVERGVGRRGAARDLGRCRRRDARPAPPGMVAGVPPLTAMVPFHVGQPLVLLLLVPLAAFVVLVWHSGTPGARSVRSRLLLGCRLAAIAALIL